MKEVRYVGYPSSLEHPLASIVPIPIEDISQDFHLSWKEIEWGLAKGLVGWRTVVGLAQRRLPSNEDEADLGLLELAYLGKSDASRTPEFVSRLAQSEESMDVAATRAKWLFLVMQVLRSRCDRLSNPQELIDILFGEFDYPDEIAGLVSWMPMHTFERSIEEEWDHYFAEGGTALVGSSGSLVPRPTEIVQ